MPPPFLYFPCWLTAMIVAISLVIARRDTFRLTSRDYQAFLSPVWKLLSFAIAVVGLSILSRYSDDPTWDIPETIILSGLTFVTAPWAVGVVCRATLGCERGWWEVYVAACFWLFSSSWCYDAYVWAWFGFYPFTWLGNLMISPFLYLLAGMFWSLETRNNVPVLAFLEPVWFTRDGHSLGSAIAPAIAFIVIIIGIFGLFLIVNTQNVIHDFFR